MHVQRAGQGAVGFGYQQAVDVVGLHVFQGLGGKFVGGDGFRGRVHDVVHGQTGEVVALLEQAAQVAVGQRAFQTARFGGCRRA